MDPIKRDNYKVDWDVADPQPSPLASMRPRGRNPVAVDTYSLRGRVGSGSKLVTVPPRRFQPAPAPSQWLRLTADASPESQSASEMQRDRDYWRDLADSLTQENELLRRELENERLQNAGTHPNSGDSQRRYYDERH